MTEYMKLLKARYRKLKLELIAETVIMKFDIDLEGDKRILEMKLIRSIARLHGVDLKAQE